MLLLFHQLCIYESFVDRINAKIKNFAPNINFEGQTIFLNIKALLSISNAGLQTCQHLNDHIVNKIVWQSTLHLMLSLQIITLIRITDAVR